MLMVTEVGRELIVKMGKAPNAIAWVLFQLPVDAGAIHCSDAATGLRKQTTARKNRKNGSTHPDDKYPNDHFVTRSKELFFCYRIVTRRVGWLFSAGFRASPSGS